MKTHEEKILEFYRKTPLSFQDFSSRVFAALCGHEKEGSREYLLKTALKHNPKFNYEEASEWTKRILDSAEEMYESIRMEFSYDFYHLCHEIGLSKNLCMAVAKWLNRQHKGSKADFCAVMKGLSYLCGTKEDRAMEFLKTATYEQLYEAYIETLDYMNDQILTPWVPDKVKEEEKLMQANGSLSENNEE